jgi:hypothetical protein
MGAGAKALGPILIGDDVKIVADHIGQQRRRDYDFSLQRDCAFDDQSQCKDGRENQGPNGPAEFSEDGK